MLPNSLISLTKEVMKTIVNNQIIKVWNKTWKFWFMRGGEAFFGKESSFFTSKNFVNNVSIVPEKKSVPKISIEEFIVKLSISDSNNSVISEQQLFWKLVLESQPSSETSIPQALAFPTRETSTKWFPQKWEVIA